MHYLEAEFAAAKAAPLSARKARLVAMLIDAYADRLFAAGRGGEDVLEFRAVLATRAPALAAVFAVAADKAQLVTEAIEVPLSDYPTLDIADFMVCLYNNHTVQRVRIALPDGTRLPAHETLAEAIDALRELSAEAPS